MNPETYLPPENKPHEGGFDLSNVNINELQPTANMSYLLQGFQHEAVQKGKFSGLNTLQTDSMAKMAQKYNLSNLQGSNTLSNNPVENILIPGISLQNNEHHQQNFSKNKLLNSVSVNSAPKTNSEQDMWTFSDPVEQIALPPLDGSPVPDNVDYSEWPDWFAHDPELGETVVTHSPEHEASSEKLTKAQKVGKVVMKAVSFLAGASPLAPGTALQYAKPLDKPHEPQPAVQPEVFDIPDVWKVLIPEPEQAPQPKPVVEAEKHEQWTGAFEQKGYIVEAPRFRDQVTDTTRTNTFKFVSSTDSGSYDSPGYQSVELTEHEGLVGLEKFFRDYIELCESDPDYRSEYGERLNHQGIAQGMLENLTFIGAKEYEEAVKGLGDYWKAYLDEDPARQICLPSRYSRNSGIRKSDLYLSERILDTFTDEELENYGGRIITEVKDITAAPENLKIIMLDDWTISGAQMRSTYDSLHKSLGDKYDASMEVNLLTASPYVIENGISTYKWGKPGPVMPVRAYYLAHPAPETSGEMHKAHISGTHSSVDFDFDDNIRLMARQLREAVSPTENGKELAGMPPLSNIVRSYRYSEPAVVVERNRITKRRRTSDPSNTPVATDKPSKGEEEEEEER